jgi:hypothetical protein
MITGMSDEQPHVTVICPDCETESKIPLSELEGTITRHNDRLHDGEQRAKVDPAITDHMADLAAEDLGLLDEES